MSTSLVDKAKELRRNRKAGANLTTLSDEELDLLLAYLRGEVTGNQVGHALNRQEYYAGDNWVRSVIRQAVRSGQLIVSRAPRRNPISPQDGKA